MTPAFLPERHQGDAAVQNERHRGRSVGL